MREIIVDKSKCMGCGACYNKCPKNAIDMVPDDNGFLYPSIQSSLCVECGLCDTACPALHPLYKNSEHPECFAMWADDEVRMKSSSGGAFSLLAEWILKEHGAVVGAIYDGSFSNVTHVMVESIEDLEPLRSSKYVQSTIGNAFQKTQNALKAGRKVLFTGTPCQVAGLYSFLGRDYENLFTTDLICHGTPPQALLEKFLQEESEKAGAEVTRLSFRDKHDWGWNHGTSIDFANGEKYRKSKSKCSWMHAFLSGLMFRESCAQCPFARLPRQGDLSIGDFWDIHLHDRSLDDQKGTSLLLVNSEKGKRMLDVLQAASQKLVPAPIEHASKYNGNIVRPSRHHPSRERFMRLVRTHSFEKSVDFALNGKYDIGYVGWWYGKNYGSALTSFALNRYLVSLGKTVLMIDFPLMHGEKPSTGTPTKTRQFAAHFYDSFRRLPLSDHGCLNSKCDTFVVGSDQLWNWWSNRDVGSYYFFLDFVDQWHKKISYSTSFGHDSGYYPVEMQLKISWLLSRFDAISVREKSAIKILKKNFGANAVQTADPVFLCTMEDWEHAVAISHVDTSGEYVLAYILNPTAEKRESIRFVAKQLGLPYRIILDGQGDMVALQAEMDDPNVLTDVGVEDWLKYMKNSSYVLTDSFHGFCFSIIFEKQMTIFPNKQRGLPRFESLSEWSGVNRSVNCFDEVTLQKHLTDTIDFSSVRQAMEPMIHFSKTWLDTALNLERKTGNFQELLLRKLMEQDEKILELRQSKDGVQQPKESPKVSKGSKTLWLRRKLVRGRQCLKDNGLCYTIRHLFRKIRNRFSR